MQHDHEPIPNAIIGYLPDGRPVYEVRGGSGEGEPETTETETTEETSAEGSETEETGSDDEDNGLDDKVKAKLSKLRGEAAGWRTQVRNLQKQLESAVRPEDFEKVKTELSDALAAKDRELVIAKHKLPKELAALLPEKGKTADELDELAKGLAKFVTPEVDEPEENLSGGLSGKTNKGGASDPRARAAQVRARQHRNRVF